MISEESSAARLAKFQAAFAKSNELIHLNNAGLALSSLPAIQTAQHWLQRFHTEAMHCNDDYMAAAETARAHLALLVGAAAEEIAFFQSTAGAISQVAFGMDLRPDDEVLLWDQEYASNLYPWREACLRTQARLVLAESEADLSTPAEKILAQVTDRTKVIALSWVQFQTGAMTELAQIASFARARGIWTVIDVIQGLGLRPFDFHALGIDAACGGSHKWLVSPVGVGFLILRRDRLQQLRPLTVGSSTFGTCDDPVSQVCWPKPSALRFESGSKQVLEITALGASAQLLSEISPNIIAAEADRLAELLRRGLLERNYRLHQPKNGSGNFVNFSDPLAQDSQSICRTLSDHHVSHAVRGPGVRFATQAYNTEADVERVLRILDR